MDTKPDAPGQRMLAAIVFTDAVGFSARVGENEEATLDLIRKDIATMSELCTRFEGQVIKSSGDGLMMMFTSAVQAVTCALEIQKIFNEQSKRDTGALMHRIGVHLGDVLVMQGDALGDGVNVAARLEQEAEPGGICLSQTVYDVVKNRLFLQAAKIGDLKLKNISEPVVAYKIAGVGKAKKHVRVYRWSWGSVAALLAVVAIAGGGATYFLVNRGQNQENTDPNLSALNLPAQHKNSDSSNPKSDPADTGSASKSAPGSDSTTKPGDQPSKSVASDSNVPTPAPPKQPAATSQADSPGSQQSPAASGGTPSTAVPPSNPGTSPAVAKLEYEDAWRRFGKVFDFKGMADWIGANPSSIPTGVDSAVEQKRLNSLAEFIDWFNKRMAGYTEQSPLTIMWKKAPAIAWMAGDGFVVRQSSRDAHRTLATLTALELAALARGIAMDTKAVNGARMTIREDVQTMLFEFNEHSDSATGG